MKPLVIICGLGQIGFRCFELLHAAGFRACIITTSASDDWMLAVTKSGGRVILGDARSDAKLIEANIDGAMGIIVATDQDITNVSIAMDARRLNPSIRIVCRMFDTNLGKHIRDAFGVTQVFSTSELSAPAFVEALHQYGIGNATRSTSGYRLMSSAPLQNRIASISDLLEHRVDNSAVAGSLYLCVTKTEESQRSSKGASRRMLELAFSPAFLSYRKIASFILAVIVTSAAILTSSLQISFLDATYFVTTTITTVGYGDYNFSTAPAPVKIFGICLMLIGAGSLAVLYSAVTESLFTKRMISTFGGKPIPRRDHIILVGAGHLGGRIADMLMSSGIPFVVVENDTLGRFSVDVKRHTSVIDGDPKTLATLRRCNVDRASAVMTISDDDVENLSVALTARTANSLLRTIVRVFDPNLGSGLQTNLQLDAVISMSRNAAPYFVAALVADEVQAATVWGHSLVFVAKHCISAETTNLGRYSADELADVAVGALPLHR